jgi:deoxyribodipyrimidine photo-lyase
MKQFKKSLFWFRRDLRLNDNAALHKALKESEQVFLCFVFDTNILDKLADRDDRRLTYIWSSIAEMQEKLKKYNSEISLFYGDPQELIPEIVKQGSFDAVFTNRDYEAYPLNRDQFVQTKLHELKAHFVTCKDHVLFEAYEVSKPDKSPYTIFTPFKRTLLKVLETDFEFYLKEYPSVAYLNESSLIARDEAFSLQSKLISKGYKIASSLQSMGFIENPPIIPTGASKAGEQLSEFLKNKARTYQTDRNLMSVDGTSNISPHLRFGTLSVRECFRKAFQSKALCYLLAEKENVDSWISELIWREFYSMVLQAFPHVQEKSFKKEYQNLMWRVDEKLLNAWCDGLTGYPIVDAAMRQLKSTGLMHNRARMIAASFLTKDLLIDWKEGEKHFARYLLDFELASNNGGWQWSASTGTDAAPYFRVFNPSLQSEKFDPQAIYIKKYVPELSHLEPGQIHKMTFICPNYPKPVVRHEEAKSAVLNLFKSAKQKISAE